MVNPEAPESSCHSTRQEAAYFHWVKLTKSDPDFTVVSVDPAIVWEDDGTGPHVSVGTASPVRSRRALALTVTTQVSRCRKRANFGC